MPTAYVTAPPEAAGEIARRLVEERLAACVNAVDCTSTYRWEGSVHEDEAAVVRENHRRALRRARRAGARAPPYDVPCIERIEDDPVESFTAWRADSVTPE